MRPALPLCPWLRPAFERLEQAAIAGRLGHGCLISGPRGIGKRNLAWVLADRILNRRIGTPAPEAATPAGVLGDYDDSGLVAELHPDLHRIRPEEGKATIVVEQIRGMLADLALTPLSGSHKLVLIEQADRMTTGAANALLKTLEEPTGDTYLLLLAERPGRLPATIRSRCQHLPLRLPAAGLTRQWLSTDDSGPDEWLPGIGRLPPIALAGLLNDPDKYNIYNKIYSDLESISGSGSDPHAMAEAWNRADPELALGCLIDSLRATIRQALVPRHTNGITEAGGLIMDNCLQFSSIGALFERLRIAEDLREQIGRGANIELALRALLLGLAVGNEERLYA